MRAALLVVALAVTSVATRAAAPADPARFGPDMQVRGFAMCPDGASVAVRGDKEILVVDWPGGRTRLPTSESELPPCAAGGLGFSPDGRLYARTSANGTITILDAATRATRHTLSGHLGTVGAVAFSPDGRWLASGGLDNDVRLWDVSVGTCARTLTLPSHATFAVAWAPDGRTLYTAGASRTVIAWNVATGDRVRESSSLGKPIRTLSISADGARLLAGTFSAEGTSLPADLRVLDAATFAQQAVIPSPDGGAVSTAFSPDGRQILWASAGGRGIMVTTLDHRQQ